ncbi:MAG: FKBP-type peptidyl-prolyl cis-trans isomerase [Burkholderiaceae bacterium]|nr:FKBP-type peptidyl-prolyl cis-trans isomerase [Burkholderiaceae bacterium]
MNDGNSPDAGVVRPGAHLTVHYRLSLPERGEDVISTFGGKPATFELGQGQLSESLERVIIGMREGERAVFELGPEQAYGDRQAALVRTLSRSSFDANVDPGREHVPGDVVDFPMPGGGRYAGVVKSIDAEAVELDFNHPLAGRRIAFEVEILGVL